MLETIPQPGVAAEPLEVDEHPCSAGKSSESGLLLSIHPRTLWFLTSGHPETHARNHR